MNPPSDRSWETQLSRELQQLPLLAAPQSLARRVLAAVDRRSRAPWYRRCWQTWPVPLRAISLGLMVMMFGGLCWVGAKVSHAQAWVSGVDAVGNCCSGLRALGNTLEVLLGSATLLTQKVSPGSTVAMGWALVPIYFLAVGLGTFFVRGAMLKRRDNS